MARREPAPVWFQTRVSNRLILYLLASHGLAALALWLAVLPSWLQVTLAAALVLSLGHGLWVHGARRTRRAVRALHWRSDGTWRVLDGQGGAAGYTGQRVILAHPALVLVRLTGPERSRWLLLAADSADAEALRRLRVRLRAVAGQDAPQDGPLGGR